MTYVVSDIHGNLQRFDSILKQIQLQPDDTLYVLGDVIDRYPDGIKILGRIMKMPNVKMLLGNHEYMMLNAIGHCSDAAEEEFYTNWSARSLWYRNGGEVTHRQLKHMRKDFRANLFDFLYHLPVNLETEVNGIKYKLVHASPVENYYISSFSEKYLDQREFAVWNRWKQSQPVPDGYKMIFGHTPTFFFQETEPLCLWKNENAIGIDCGCGYVDGRLLCLRLDDMKEFYSEENNAG